MCAADLGLSDLKFGFASWEEELAFFLKKPEGFDVNTNS